jgi:hypothetical protein
MPNSFSSGGDAAAQADIMRALARAANPDGARNGDKYERIKAEKANRPPRFRKGGGANHGGQTGAEKTNDGAGQRAHSG